MELNRRDFMKANAALAAAAAAGMTIPVKQVNATEDMASNGIKPHAVSVVQDVAYW